MTQARNSSPVDPDRHSLFDEPDPTPAEPPVAIPLVEPPIMRPDELEMPVDAATRRPRPNPFLVLLWVLAAALVGLGFWAQARALAPLAVVADEPPTVEQFYVIPAVLGAIAPAMIAIGLAAIVAAVSLHALQWARRHDS